MTNTYNAYIDNVEKHGYFASTKYYDAMIEVQQKNIETYNKQLVDLTNAMNEAVNSGSVDIGSEAWYEFQQKINGVRESILEANNQILEFKNNIRDIKWDHFDYLQEQISNITDESDFLIDLMSSSDLFDKKGVVTDKGKATFGLRGQNYNVYMAQANKYADEIKKLNAEIANDPNNTKLIDRQNELVKAQYDAISAAKDEKDAIIDLVKDGIDKELDALQDLIDKYTDALDKQSDLRDYQNEINDKAEKLAQLQKQMAAYSGDTSEQGRSNAQKIQADLKDAQKDLENSQYEHNISEQKKLLSDLYDEYEETLNKRLEDTDELIRNVIDQINTDSGDISKTIEEQAKSVGYTLSDAVKDIWKNDGTATSIITKYGEDFSSKLTTVNEVINKIALKIGAMEQESEKQAEQNIQTAQKEQEQQAQPQQPPQQDNTQTNDTPQVSDETIKGIAAAIWVYGNNSGWGNEPVRSQRLTQKLGAENAAAVQNYINAHASNGDLFRYWQSSGKNLSQYYYSKFKSGGLADYTGFAWMDGTPRDPELVLNAEETQKFLDLKNTLSKLTSEEISSLNYGQNTVGGYESYDRINEIVKNLSVRNNTSNNIGINVNIPIEHVSDYNDFVNQLTSDVKFQRFLRTNAATMFGKASTLELNNFKW